MTVAKIYIFVLSFFFFKETHAYVIMCQSVIETYRKKISNHTSKFDKSTKYVYLIPFDIKDRCFLLDSNSFRIISTFTSPTFLLDLDLHVSDLLHLRQYCTLDLPTT